MTGDQGLLAARLGLGFNSTLGLLFGGLLLLGAPIMVMEGEDLPVIVLGCLLGLGQAALGGIGILLLLRLDHPIPGLAARGLTLLQLVTMFCFCGVLPLFGTVAVWLGLLVADRERG